MTITGFKCDMCGVLGAGEQYTRNLPDGWSMEPYDMPCEGGDSYTRNINPIGGQHRCPSCQVTASEEDRVKRIEAAAAKIEAALAKIEEQRTTQTEST